MHLLSQQNKEKIFNQKMIITFISHKALIHIISQCVIPVLDPTASMEWFYDQEAGNIPCETINFLVIEKEIIFLLN